MRDRVIKVANWFEDTVPLMLPREFRRFFRMNDEMLAMLTHFLSTNEWLHTVSPRATSLEKKIAMTCTYLETASPTIL